MSEFDAVAALLGKGVTTDRVELFVWFGPMVLSRAVVVGWWGLVEVLLGLIEDGPGCMIAQCEK